LIFAPHLNLDELIIVTRSCKTFYSNERVKRLIEKKIKERFSNFQRKCWNKFGIPKRLFVYYIVSSEMYIIRKRSRFEKDLVMICSTEERAIKLFNAYRINFDDPFTRNMFFDSYDKRIKPGIYFPFIDVIIYGIDEYILKVLEEKMDEAVNKLNNTKLRQVRKS
jgi:hypothetical protein